MTGTAISRPRGGIRKHQRRDRDGDLVMAAAPRVNPIGAAQRTTGSGPRPKTHKQATGSFTELKVTGWSDVNEVPKIINFLERHSARRSPSVAKNSIPPKMVKRHRHSDSVLNIWVRPEDVIAFGKINGFTFNSTHGTQKLTIAGPGIRSKSPAASTSNTSASAMDVASSNDTIDAETLLKGFLERRYDVEKKLLNLSTIADDEEVSKSGMWNQTSTQQKFFPALMVVCDKVLETPDQKRELIQSVTLSGNNLPNLDIIYRLATTLPHILNLDLSGNRFTSLRDIKSWKGRLKSLEHLIIEIAESGWEEELISWFPKLRILNGQQVRPEPAAAPSVPTPTISTAEPPANLAPTSLADSTPTFTQEQEAMVAYVMEQTRLKREMAIQCLEAADWNIETAAQLFLEKKDTLSQDSFN